MSIYIFIMHLHTFYELYDESTMVILFCISGKTIREKPQNEFFIRKKKIYS